MGVGKTVYKGEVKTGVFAWFFELAATNVGAGLLAKAVCQSAQMPPDTPPSRASPLPQVAFC
ncbi:FAD_binding_2 domain-containing protein [Pseudomonas sp. IT-P258]